MARRRRARAYQFCASHVVLQYGYGLAQSRNLVQTAPVDWIQPSGHMGMAALYSRHIKRK